MGNVVGCSGKPVFYVSYYNTARTGSGAELLELEQYKQHLELGLAPEDQALVPP